MLLNVLHDFSNHLAIFSNFDVEKVKIATD